QELARRIGLERYRVCLARLDFDKTGTVVDTFWLDGRLKSARLRRQDLPRCWRSRNSMPPHVRSRLPATLYDSKAATGLFRFTEKPAGASRARRILDGGRDGWSDAVRSSPSR